MKIKLLQKFPNEEPEVVKEFSSYKALAEYLVDNDQWIDIEEVDE